MKVLDLILLVFLLALLAVGLYILYQNVGFGNNPPQYANYTSSQTQENYSNGGQFYPNMRYPDKEISYLVEDSCSKAKKADVEEAFNIISQNTILTFHQVSSNPEIDVLCSNIAPTASEEGHFVAGEGGPSQIINTSLFSVILTGKIALYRDETCSTPHIAIHEIFHALGFDHSQDPHSIMYPVTSCDQTISSYLIEDIQSLYSVPSYPDLAIEDVSAVKSGSYLDFNITVKNIGLKDIANSTLLVIADGNEVKRFEIDNMSIGIRQKINVQNLKIPRNTGKVDFVISAEELELTKANNQVEILLA
jgi:predicted Zn-dependent protease